jgi:ribosome-binding protein aMBF1 (putative translation factor)
MRFLLSYPHEIERRRRELGMSLQDVATISRISYTQLQDIERGRIQTLAAPVLDALAETLDCDASRFSADWFPPHAPRVTMVYVRAEMVREYLDKSGLNANELARRADVPPPIVYGFRCRGKRSCRAPHAEKLARAMGVAPSEFAPALAVYPA